ncbi:MAG: Gfo/Idh/MocA family oxidoreductase [Victivallaceae bacterium]|nr:Gfo/Idh/MocA family oxidoreductase [Victivallaceae bacterium]
MMKKIRYGIIGLGFFGEKHAEVLSSMPDVELSAVSTRRPDRLKEIAERFRVPRSYTNYRDLLADPEIEAVSVVAHMDDHRDIVIAALQAGKHVFLEKPMAGTPEDCDAIIAAAQAGKGEFMVGHICRFDTRVALAKKAIDNGRIGRVVSMHAARNLPASIGAGVLDKISPLMGDGIHDTDLMLWFTGERVKTVYAQNVRVRNFKYPDIGWAMYRFEGGAVGVIETVWHLPDNTPFSIDARLEIIGTEGAIYIDCGNSGLAINDKDGLSKPDTRYWPDLFGRRVGVLRDELSYFIECLRAGKSPDIISDEESKMAVTVVCAAEESAASGKVITLT